MSNSRGSTAALPDLTSQVFRHTADAWEDGLGAAVEHDVRAARHVMRGAQARRSMLRAAHQRMLRDTSSPGRTTGRPVCPPAVITDLARINRLLGQLSQCVIATPGATALVDRERDDVDAARRVGSRRLWFFAESMPHPTIDREYVVAGHDLLDALGDLTDRGPRPGTAPDVCIDLMIALVETSRHATRIA